MHAPAVVRTAATLARGAQARLPASCAHLRAITSARSRLAVAGARSTSAAVGQLWKMHTCTKITKPGAKFQDCLWQKFVKSSLSPAVTALHKGSKYVCFYRARVENIKTSLYRGICYMEVRYKQA